MIHKHSMTNTDKHMVLCVCPVKQIKEVIRKQMNEYVIIVMLLAVLVACSAPAMAGTDPCICESPYNYQPCLYKCGISDTVNGM